MRIITLGTFDLLHLGHIKLLKRCFHLGEHVTVGLNTDEFVSKYKGKAPVMTFEEREQAIYETELVDVVLKNDQASGSAKELIKESGAKLIVIGSDWARKDYVGQLGLNWDWLDRQGIGICYLNYTKGISTTELKRRICESA